MKPFFISIPHSGELVPENIGWLQGLPEQLLMCDVDRFVHEIYQPGVEFLGLPSVVADIHRYVIDLNRWPEDVDQRSVEDSPNPPGSFTTGLHWVETTTGATLMKEPMPKSQHDQLVEDYYQPFHDKIKKMFSDFKSQGAKQVFHLDAHSMPSRGTEAHRDPGALRPQIVVSDCDGKSCDPIYKDLVIKAYESVGFEVAYNWPYKGGRITQTYGQPAAGQHAVQVEMSRALYMDEISKHKVADKLADVQKQVSRALAVIYSELPNE